MLVQLRLDQQRLYFTGADYLADGGAIKTV
jgi:hypothetical protein